MTTEIIAQPNTYGLKIRLLGNEVFAVELGSSSTSSGWVIGSLASIFAFLTLIGAYGDKLAIIYHNLVGG